MRDCPVCQHIARTEVFSMTYKIPDSWTLPAEIVWYTCARCQMIYGDGSFDQSGFDTYYRERYGYGINNPANVERLIMDALAISTRLEFNKNAVIADFGGAGDDGKSVLVETLRGRGYARAVCVNVGEAIPKDCDVIYASHVIEHIYNLPETMSTLVQSLAPKGLLMIDVPDATGLLLHWRMPILDFNTKHLNHFTLRNLLDLGFYHGLELVHLKQYRLENAPAYQATFQRLDVAKDSAFHILLNITERVQKLRKIQEPFNIWGLGDITWHITSLCPDLPVLSYIDNDPAYRHQTYNGKPVQEHPMNDAPIVILAQGQRGRLVENIRKMGIQNSIIEI